MIDEWIKKLPANDQLKLKTEYWCLGNQNKWYKHNSTWEETTDTSGDVYSETWKKIYNNETFDLKCGEESTKVSDLGGLLTAEEVALSGPFKDNDGWKSYLWIDYNKVNHWWLATPVTRSSEMDRAYVVEGVGFDIYFTGGISAIRPSIVLQSGIKIISGDGTKENAYTIE